MKRTVHYQKEDPKVSPSGDNSGIPIDPNRGFDGNRNTAIIQVISISGVQVDEGVSDGLNRSVPAFEGFQNTVGIIDRIGIPKPGTFHKPWNSRGKGTDVDNPKVNEDDTVLSTRSINPRSSSIFHVDTDRKKVEVFHLSIHGSPVSYLDKLLDYDNGTVKNDGRT